MKLNEDNYFSVQAMTEYCSKSQLMTFAECEHRALAEMRGEYVREPSDSMLLGSYVDCMLLTPNELPKFISKHPELFKKDGELYAKYAIGNVMVDRCKRDNLFMKSIVGDHQTIMTSKIFDVPFKIKMDVFNDGKYITDLKSTADLDKEFYDKTEKRFLNVFEHFGYALQGAIYVETVYQNTGKRLPFFLSVVTTQAHPRLKIVQIDEQSMEDALLEYEPLIRSIPMLKNGTVEPNRCEKCDYCADTMVLNGVSDWLGREVE